MKLSHLDPAFSLVLCCVPNGRSDACKTESVETVGSL